MKTGIVGHESAKFTSKGESEARIIIRKILGNSSTLVSGHSHLGGIDIWAEEEAKRLGLPMLIHAPKSLSWAGGFKERNLAIARDSDEVHVIVVNEFAPGFKGKRFPYCYHCHTSDHIKSGACWTALRSKKGVWHVIDQRA